MHCAYIDQSYRLYFATFTIDSGIDWPWTKRNFHMLLNLALIEYGFDWNNRKQEIINALRNAPAQTRQFVIDYVRVDKLQ